MENNRIKHLLEKYFEGQSTLAEEQELVEYFSGNHEFPDSLVRYRSMFSLLHMNRYQGVEIRGMENKIAGLIRDDEASSKPLPGRKRFYRYAAAATIAVLVGLSGVLLFQKSSSPVTDTYADPQLAYIEAQKALMYVSEKMNKGIKPLSSVSKINSATSQLKSLEKMDRSLEMLNLVSIIYVSSNLKK
ncbi:MAG TPA: hypothetical protein VJ203_02340 [Bacteroidales bacterium]|nr:hypothetical protein [Bacteroidales bacterium]